MALLVPLLLDKHVEDVENVPCEKKTEMLFAWIKPGLSIMTGKQMLMKH